MSDIKHVTNINTKICCYIDKKKAQTSAWKNLNFSGHNQVTIGLPINLDKRKHEDAPAVALKTTNIIPLTTPKRAPANNDMKIVPGIINVCIKIYVEQYPIINCAGFSFAYVEN
jgi:hypothetical protein